MLQCPLEKSQRIEPESVLYSNASMDQTGRLPENAADASTKASADKKVMVRVEELHLSTRCIFY